MSGGQALQQQCDRFNADYEVGQLVTVRKDNGEGFITRTRSQAQVLSGHSAVIWVEGLAGCYLLDRIVPMVGIQGKTGSFFIDEAAGV